ncbi:DinB family protein [Flavobacterium poyangense]|uniref:DinB family protein n=1 Tax=Flavobacterium poyangense TaxID=2204302 RepID=UPI00141F3053|nr:DinB family protein [Flavobacterium sp. JXAS1]
MTIKSEDLIKDLIGCTHQIMSKAEALKAESNEVLNYRINSKSWSILECLEHLNLYGRFYLPEITGQIQKNNSKQEDYFKSGWLGNYFAKSMLPKEKLNKMKTFKSMNPINSKLDKVVIDDFINQQIEMLELLNQARVVSLAKTKTAISISKGIRLKLGDTFRIVIYHNQRHIAQAERVLGEANGN